MTIRRSTTRSCRIRRCGHRRGTSSPGRDRSTRCSVCARRRRDATRQASSSARSAWSRMTAGWVARPTSSGRGRVTARSRRRCAAVVLGLLSVGVVQLAGAASCPEGISSETARDVTRLVEGLRPGDGYHLEGVRAKDDLVVLWSRHGKACFPIRIDFHTCPSSTAPATHRVHWSPEQSADCPELQSVATTIARGLGSDPPIQPQLPPPLSATPLILVAVWLAVAPALRTDRPGRRQRAVRSSRARAAACHRAGSGPAARHG